MTQLKKATFRVYWVGQKKPQDIEVQYNPTEYTFEKQNQVAEIQIPGLDSPLQQFVRGQTEKLTLDLFFDTTEKGTGSGATSVTTETDKIYQLIKIEPKRHAPPILEFVWSDQIAGSNIGEAPGSVAGALSQTIGAATGAAAGAAGSAIAAAGSVGGSAVAAAGAGLGNQRRTGFRCVLDSVRQKFTLFSPDGVPLRATLTVSLREYKTLQNQLDELHLTSADRTHVHVLEQGETLAAIANLYYETPADWREIATKNTLDDPRRLTPGVFLEVPALR